MRKYDLLSALSEETAKEVARNDRNWKKYLNTASKIYKYPFKDHLLIYAQRPDEIWNMQTVFPLPELMILRYLTNNKRVALSTVQEITQTPIDEARKSCNDLVKNGLIELSGKEYMLTPKVYGAIKSMWNIHRIRLYNISRQKVGF